ncbi:MAG: hypothetical protein DDG60_10690 [Anaerolineae bacterium]|nr:MAG: hypothetical protein DDG60_10690 [Anaerolineae bacterium]
MLQCAQIHPIFNIEETKVPNPRKPLRLNVGFLVSAAAGYHRDFDFYLPKLTDEEDQTLTLAEVQGRVRISRTPQGLLVEGTFEGDIQLECVRCLSEYTQHLRWEFTELYAFTRDNITDSGLLVPEDAHIDLQPLVRDFGLLEIPIKPLCKSDCKGLCPECGQNLNLQNCGHAPENDSPFSTLKDWL